MFDNYLTPDQKRDLLGQRLTQFAAEAYQHQLNRELGAATGDSQLVANSEAALATLTKAIEVHEQELTSLDQ